MDSPCYFSSDSETDETLDAATLEPATPTDLGLVPTLVAPRLRAPMDLPHYYFYPAQISRGIYTIAILLANGETYTHSMNTRPESHYFGTLHCCDPPVPFELHMRYDSRKGGDIMTFRIAEDKVGNVRAASIVPAGEAPAHFRALTGPSSRFIGDGPSMRPALRAMTPRIAAHARSVPKASLPFTASPAVRIASKDEETSERHTKKRHADGDGQQKSKRKHRPRYFFFPAYFSRGRYTVGLRLADGSHRIVCADIHGRLPCAYPIEGAPGLQLIALLPKRKKPKECVFAVPASCIASVSEMAIVPYGLFEVDTFYKQLVGPSRKFRPAMAL
jgi:hypothetical protein